jgi:uncharacterized membrane protein YfcA
VTTGDTGAKIGALIGRKRAFAIVRNAPQTFTAIVGIAVLAVILDFVWKRVRDTPASASHATTSS